MERENCKIIGAKSPMGRYLEAAQDFPLAVGTLWGWRPAQVPRRLRGEAEPSRSSIDFSVLGAPHTGLPTYSSLSSHTIRIIVPQTERRVR